VVTAPVQFTRKGAMFQGTGKITHPDHASGRNTTGSIVVLGEFGVQVAASRYFNASDGGGTRVSLFHVNASTISFGGDSGSYTSLTASEAGKKCIAINYATGGIPAVYLDGIFTGNMAGALTFTANDAPIIVGNHVSDPYYCPYPIAAVMEFSRNLTATEMSQVYAELSAMKWPTKPVTKDLSVNPILPSVGGSIVAAYNMDIVNSRILDSSGNNQHFGIMPTTYIAPQKRANISFAKFNGTSGVLSTAATSNFSFGNGTTDTPFSISFLAKFNNPSAPPAGVEGLISKDTGVVGGREWAVINANGKLRIFIKDNGGANQQSIDATTVVTTNKLYHVVCTYDGRGGNSAYLGMAIYINGVLETPSAFTANSYTAMNATAAPFEVGRYFTTSYFNGEIAEVRLFKNKTLSAIEVNNLFDKYKKAGIANFSLEGAPISVAARGGAIGQFLENTPFQFGDATGRYSVSTDTVFGKANSKVISCSTAGLLYMPSTQAYGTWEFDLYKGNTASNTMVEFINNGITNIDAAATRGYVFQFSATERGIVYRMNGSSAVSNVTVSDTNYIAMSTWYRLKITRSVTGVFTTFILLPTGWVLVPSVGGGANPSTADNTYTTSNYFVIDLDATDKIANIVFKPLA
jgi:hypothetical protein